MIKTIKITSLIIYVLALGALFFYVLIKGGETLVTTTQVKIYRDTDNGFLNRDSILAHMNSMQKTDSVEVKTIKTRKLEKEFRKNPYVKNADVFTGINGELIVNINEKKPLLRIFNKDSKGYYITKEGDILPLSSEYAARVFVVNGYLNIPHEKGFNNIYDTTYADTELEGILKLATTISKNEFLNAQINQIYLNSKKEFELIPEVGKCTVILGSLNNIDVKLRNLQAFYKQALLVEGIDKYRSINLKFDGQIVCAK
jgi:cell division protein FtsQ